MISDLTTRVCPCPFRIFSPRVFCFKLGCDTSISSSFSTLEALPLWMDWAGGCRSTVDPSITIFTCTQGRDNAKARKMCVYVACYIRTPYRCVAYIYYLHLCVHVVHSCATDVDYHYIARIIYHKAMQEDVTRCKKTRCVYFATISQHVHNSPLAASP